MNNMIGAAVVSFSSLAFSCSGVSSCWIADEEETAAVAVCEVVCSVDAEVAGWALTLNCSSVFTNSFGSAPVSSLRIVPFLMSTKYGTAVMSNRSEISGKLSALMERNVVFWYCSESAKVLMTLFIWMHGDAHGVWKYNAMSLSLTDVSSEN